MTVAFNSIPIDLRTPGVYVEVDNSQALGGLIGQRFKCLLIGQKLVGGIAAANTLVRVVSEREAITLFGEGSMLVAMVRAFLANQKSLELWAIPVPDGGGAVAATGNVIIGGATTGSGTLYLYIGGQRLTVGVVAGETLSAVATKVAAAINAQATLPVTAAVNGGDPTRVDTTARHAGEAGNSIDIRVNYFSGEKLPTGLTAAITAMATGATNPTLTSAIAALGETQFQAITMPYTDAAGLTALEAELVSRWGPMRAVGGVAFTARYGTLSTLLSFGTGRNSEFVSCIGFDKGVNPPWEIAAAYTAQVAFASEQDPARPYQTLALTGILAPTDGERFTQVERDQLLRDGISTYVVDASGLVRLERPITMYQVNLQATPDISYLDVNTIYTIEFLRFSFRARFATKFPRHKLANDGTRFGPGQPVVTPKVAKAEAIALFRQWEEAGLVEGIDQFKADLVVERNAGDPSRLDILLPPDLINQLRVTAVQLQFRL